MVSYWSEMAFVTVLPYQPGGAISGQKHWQPQWFPVSSGWQLELLLTGLQPLTWQGPLCSGPALWGLEKLPGPPGTSLGCSLERQRGASELAWVGQRSAQVVPLAAAASGKEALGCWGPTTVVPLSQCWLMSQQVSYVDQVVQ